MLLDGFESERLIYKKLNEAFLEDLREFVNDPKCTRFMAFPDIPDQAKWWLDKQLNRYREGTGGINALIEKSTGKMVGTAGIVKQIVDEKDEWEIGYHLKSRFWGRGYASEAAIFCKTKAFETNFTDSIISIIHVDNIPSQKVAVRNGMIREKQTVYKGLPVYIFRVLNEQRD